MKHIAEALASIVFVLACFAACNPTLVKDLVGKKSCEVSK